VRRGARGLLPAPLAWPGSYVLAYEAWGIGLEFPRADRRPGQAPAGAMMAGCRR